MGDKTAIFDLGWCMARATRDELLEGASMTICSPGFESTPAQSIEISRRKDIEALRDACDFALNGGGRPGVTFSGLNTREPVRRYWMDAGFAPSRTQVHSGNRSK